MHTVWHGHTFWADDDKCVMRTKADPAKHVDAENMNLALPLL